MAAADTVRADEREPSQLRAISCEKGPLFRANGSAKWSQGHSTVLVAVFGPSGTSNPKAAQTGIIEVSFRARQYESGPREREFEHSIREAIKSSLILNLQPRTQTQIVIQVINEDGSLLSCAFNGVCASLVDAGIPLKNMWVSATCALTEDGTVLVDPDENEEKKATAVVCAAFPSSQVFAEDGTGLKECVGASPICCNSWGCVGVDKFMEVVEICKRGGLHVAMFNKKSLQKAFSSEL